MSKISGMTSAKVAFRLHNQEKIPPGPSRENQMRLGQAGKRPLDRNFNLRWSRIGNGNDISFVWRIKLWRWQARWFSGQNRFQVFRLKYGWMSNGGNFSGCIHDYRMRNAMHIKRRSGWI